MPIVRNSFIQMSKLTNLKGRINYISSHARQENLYAVYETTDRKFWTELAKCNQEEFKKSGTEGKCIEARELIKLHVLQNCGDDLRGMAEILAERTRSQVVQVIGRKIVLYKEGKDDKKKIVLP